MGVTALLSAALAFVDGAAQINAAKFRQDLEDSPETLITDEYLIHGMLGDHEQRIVKIHGIHNVTKLDDRLVGQRRFAVTYAIKYVDGGSESIISSMKEFITKLSGYSTPDDWSAMSQKHYSQFAEERRRVYKANALE